MLLCPDPSALQALSVSLQPQLRTESAVPMLPFTRSSEVRQSPQAGTPYLLLEEKLCIW